MSTQMNIRLKKLMLPEELYALGGMYARLPLQKHKRLLSLNYADGE